MAADGGWWLRCWRSDVRVRPAKMAAASVTTSLASFSWWMRWSVIVWRARQVQVQRQAERRRACMRGEHGGCGWQGEQRRGRRQCRGLVDTIGHRHRRHGPRAARRTTMGCWGPWARPTNLVSSCPSPPRQQRWLMIPVTLHVRVLWPVWPILAQRVPSSVSVTEVPRPPVNRVQS